MDPLAKILSKNHVTPAMKLWTKYEDTQSPSGQGKIRFETFEAGILAPILNSLSEALLLTDLSGKVKVLNKAAVQLFGGEIAEVGSPEWKSKFKLTREDKVTPFPFGNCPFQKALQGEEFDGLEGFLASPAHPDGIFVEISARSIRDESGKTYGAITLLKDISKRKATEEKLKEAKIKFETVAHLLNDIVWEWDVERNTTFRHGTHQALGYSADLVNQGQEWWMERIHPEDRNRLLGVFDKVMEGEIPSWFEEYRFQKADGSYAYVIDHGRVIARDLEGRPKRIMGAMIDITQRRIIEEKLSQFAILVESTSDTVLSIDLDGKILSWNPGAEKMWGYSATEMIGQSGKKIVGDKFEQIHAERRHRLEKGMSLLKDEVWGTTKYGEKRLVSSTVSPIRNPIGEIIGAGIISRDITDERRTEERIGRLVENLARSNKDLQQFAYVASHDLREPLRTVSSFAHILAEEYNEHIDERGHQLIHFVTDGIRRMKVLIDALLEYSKVEQAPLSKTQVDCFQLVERVKENLKVVIEETRSEIEIKSLPQVNADEVQMGQLLQNLISNAIKFNKGRLPRVTISADRQQNEWLFSIQDNGIGIEPKYQERVFQIFQRLHTSSEYQGTGLGLAICKKIVERHGGKIWFDSIPPSGTTFHFTLPA